MTHSKPWRNVAPVGPDGAALDKNRHYVELPGKFAVARWRRDADVATIARCILATLKYEPHGADLTPLRRALEGVIKQPERRAQQQGDDDGRRGTG